jgi:hypothetical protein
MDKGSERELLDVKLGEGNQDLQERQIRTRSVEIRRCPQTRKLLPYRTCVVLSMAVQGEAEGQQLLELTHVCRNARTRPCCWINSVNTAFCPFCLASIVLWLLSFGMRNANHGTRQRNKTVTVY